MAVGLLAAGSGLLFLAGSVGSRPEGSAALALVAGAGMAGVLAARGAMRRVVGGLLVLAGVLAVILGLQGGSVAAVAGGTCTLAGGAWAAWRGPGWSRMSSRYERAADADDSPHALWDALDRGEDPTR
jgi:Tryptophan-associated transmembrane protein (Trp_oprn_chp)